MVFTVFLRFILSPFCFILSKNCKFEIYQLLNISEGKKGNVNYSATSYQASCFNHYCQTTHKCWQVLHSVHKRISLDSSYPTVSIYLKNLGCFQQSQSFIFYVDSRIVVSIYLQTTTTFIYSIRKSYLFLTSTTTAQL